MLDAGEKLVARFVRRGDVCLRIRWDPAYYKQWVKPNWA